MKRYVSSKRVAGQRNAGQGVSHRQNIDGERNAKKKKPRAIVSMNDMIVTHATAVGIPASFTKSITGALRARDYRKLKEIADTMGSPQLYKDPDTYFKYASLIALFKKNESLTSPEAKTVAMKKFVAAEETCAHTNARFSELDFPVDVLRCFERASLWLDGLLGAVTDEEIVHSSSHGPGVTVGHKGNRTSELDKWMEGPYTVPAAAFKFAQHALGENPLAVHNWHVSNYNQVTFVPKNFLTKRSIAIEPKLGVYFQQGLGNVIASRLRKVDIDIRIQESNRVLALLASESDQYCTIDLAAASDTISYGLVQHLFGSRYGGHLNKWFEYMCTFRSPIYEIEKNMYPYQKFSSMGNGFTFPLETAIFASLIESVKEVLCNDTPYLVYGDDIIVHREIAVFVVDLLKHAGFTTNSEKSFFTGPFRESCGKDYWTGETVRPAFLGSIPHTMSELYGFHNSCFETGRSEYGAIMELMLERGGKEALYGPPTKTVFKHHVAQHERYTSDGYFFTNDKSLYVPKWDAGVHKYKIPVWMDLAIDYRERYGVLGEEMLFHLSLRDMESRRERCSEATPCAVNQRRSARRVRGWAYMEDLL